MGASVRWAALKRAVQQESARVLSEYERAWARVLAECGQDISHRVPLPLGRGVALWYEHDDGGYKPAVKAIVGGEPPLTIVKLSLAEHWPGRLADWEAVLASLVSVTAETIVSAWERKEEEA